MKGRVIIMKSMVNKYKISKFKRFMNGLLFGIISLLALLLCLSAITAYHSTGSEVMLPFFTAICSMLLGLNSMFRGKESRKIGKL